MLDLVLYSIVIVLTTVKPTRLLSIIQYIILLFLVTGFVPRLWVMTLWKIFAVDTIMLYYP